MQWLEIGPAPILSGIVKRNKFSDTHIRAVPTFSGKGKQELLQILGQLWRSGFSLNWNAIREITSQEKAPQRIPLPTYPFELKRYWIDPKPVEGAQVNVQNVQQQPVQLTAQEKITESLYFSKWIKSESVETTLTFSNVLFFDPQTNQGNESEFVHSL